jgi:hypothetical protein
MGVLDLFPVQDTAYAHRLNGAAMPVELLVVPGACHGVDGWLPRPAFRGIFEAQSFPR